MLHDNSIYEMKFTTSRRYGIIDSFGEKPLVDDVVVVSDADSLSVG